MRTHSAAWISQVVGGRVVGDPETAVGPDVVIDTRRTTPGALFVALPGEHVDGHDFTAAAAEAGAAAVLATRTTDTGATQVVVEDGVAALSALGRAVVEDARPGGLKVLAVTGSSGKTSTKDVLAQVLEAHAPTVAPVGSFNNEIGVPLTACRVDERTRYLVSEMGARGVGHIAWLCSLVQPDVSIVLNVGSAHLGEFGSVEGIARAKGEIVEPLAEDGWAVLNLDDHLVSAMSGRTRARLGWFSLDPEARLAQISQPRSGLLVAARDLASDDLGRYGFTLVVEQESGRSEHQVQLALLGRHQVANAAAAAAAGIVAGVPVETVVRVLNSLEHRSPWRMELRERGDGAAVINDAYNANPDSMKAALTALAEIGEARRRTHPGARVVAVLGDMLELGDQAAALHHDIGAFAAGAGVDEVWAVGEHAQDIVRGAEAGGVVGRVATVSTAASLDLAPEDVVLVKASRGLALDKVAAALLAPHGSPVDRSPSGEADPVSPVQAEDIALTNSPGSKSPVPPEEAS